MKPKHQRLLLLSCGLVGLGVAVFLVAGAFRDNLVFFYSPSDLMAKPPPSQQRLRVGGLVEKNSTLQDGERVSFNITDNATVLTIKYTGLLPDLFREGQGVVAEGYLQAPGVFQADAVLTKHDENYMPKEVQDSWIAAVPAGARNDDPNPSLRTWRPDEAISESQCGGVWRDAR